MQPPYFKWGRDGDLTLFYSQRCCLGAQKAPVVKMEAGGLVTMRQHPPPAALQCSKLDFHLPEEWQLGGSDGKLGCSLLMGGEKSWEDHENMVWRERATQFAL